MMVKWTNNITKCEEQQDLYSHQTC